MSQNLPFKTKQKTTVTTIVMKMLITESPASISSSVSKMFSRSWGVGLRSFSLRRLWEIFAIWDWVTSACVQQHTTKPLVKRVTYYTLLRFSNFHYNSAIWSHKDHAPNGLNTLNQMQEFYQKITIHYLITILHHGNACNRT